MNMKRAILRFALLTMAVALFAACTKNDSDENAVPETPIAPDSPNKTEDVVMMLPETKPIELTDEQKALIQKNNDFSFNLFRALEQQTEVKRSNALSPISVTYVMGMLNDGAAGKTAQEIASVLGFGSSSATTVNELCKNMIEGIPLVDPTVSLTTANYIAARQDVVLEEQFKKDMDAYYHAEVASLDFSLPESKQTINDWCSRQTDGKITEMIEELNNSIVLILLNAVNFKATWTENFDPKDTKPGSFTKDDNTTCELPLMHRKADILYQANDTYASIYLPYGGKESKWGMTVLLPNEGKTVEDIINSLTATGWKESKAQMQPAFVDIQIPRFKTASNNYLKKAIASLGAPSVFDPENANFSKISANFKELFVSEMLQKAAIEVNEEGTELVAVTAALMAGFNPPPLSYDFHANRPFVYVIQEASSGAIFFIGTFRGE